MKILEVIFDLSPGGAERLVVDLSNELSKSSEVVLITLKDDGVNPDRRRFYLPELSERVKYRNLGIRDGKGFSISTFRTIYKAFKEENADVLHVHLAPIVNFCLPSFYLLSKKMTIVQTLHTDFKVGHTSFVYKLLFSTLGRRHRMRWVALSKPNYDDMMAAHPKVLGTCIRNARGPVKQTEKFEDVKKELSLFKQTENTKLFVHVARCIEVKNQMMLVKAFNSFVESGADASLVVIGADFDSALGDSIRGAAGERVHFIGTRTNVADYLLCSDCFCLSSHYEGLPISVLEAILSGLPVVTTPLPGVLDAVKADYNAKVSEDFDCQTYCAALKSAYDNLDALKANALAEKDRGEFSIETCAARYIDFFKLEN